MTIAAIQTVILQRQDVLFHHGNTVQPSRNQKDLTAEPRRTRRSSLGAHASSVPGVSATRHAGTVRSQENPEKILSKR